MNSASDVPGDVDQTEDAVRAKRPAPVVKATKKAPAKKAAAKKAPVKKAPAKKAPAKKAPVAKASAKKAPAKKAPVAKASANEAHVNDADVEQVPVKKARTPRPVPVHNGQSAIVFSVTEEMLNDLLPFLVGAGIPIEPLDTTISLPGMGDVDVRLGLTVTAVHGVLDPAHGGRVKVIVSADGTVSTRTIDFEGDTVGSLDTPTPTAPTVAGMMLPNASIPVVGEALVQPFIELDTSGRISVGIDLANAEFISIKANQDAAAPAGVEPTAWPGMVAVFSMLLGGIGGDLFDALGEHVGDAMVELDEELGSVFVALGGRPGPLSISISSGLVTVSLPADSTVRGHALPVPIAGKRVGVGFASSVVDQIAQIALFHAAGDLPLPFELEVTLDEQAVGGRLRNTRVFPEIFPDLRGALRTEVRTRLLRGQLELSVQSAWIEMPSIIPSFVNGISKRLGGLVALAPFKVTFPAIVPVPLPEDAGSLDVKIDDLRVTVEGIGLVASLA